jgi:hypothetical protein
VIPKGCPGSGCTSCWISFTSPKPGSFTRSLPRSHDLRNLVRSLCSQGSVGVPPGNRRPYPATRNSLRLANNFDVRSTERTPRENTAAHGCPVGQLLGLICLIASPGFMAFEPVMPPAALLKSVRIFSGRKNRPESDWVVGTAVASLPGFVLHGPPGGRTTRIFHQAISPDNSAPK